MAVKGAIAKENVINKISEAFGSDFIGVVDKKVYVWTEENGERVQISLSLTCPKNIVGTYTGTPVVVAVGDKIDFEDPISPVQQSTDILEDEQKTIEDLMKRLGL